MASIYRLIRLRRSILKPYNVPQSEFSSEFREDFPWSHCPAAPVSSVQMVCTVQVGLLQLFGEIPGPRFGAGAICDRRIKNALDSGTILATISFMRAS